jgi:hypothetical protein
VFGLFCAITVVITLIVIALAYNGATPLFPNRDNSSLDQRVPVGVIGDSDSCSYQGRIRFTPGDSPWGGAFHASTLQWPEVFARIRDKQVYFGEWKVWGIPRRLSLARMRDTLGLRWRGPRKEDYRYNFAWPSGCSSLLESGWRQVPRLVEVMNEDPARWSRGVVIIRIGINDFGKESLDNLAIDPNSFAVRKIMRQCLTDIEKSVALIRSKNSKTRIVLVGIFDNTNWAIYLHNFRSTAEISNISKGLDYFDNGLRSLCASGTNMAFFDDRAWFRSHWGGRDSDGQPAYNTIAAGSRLKVRNTAGDAPENAVLANGHAGLVWNVLWVQSLVNLMRTSFGLPIDAISDEEVGEFIDARVK